MTGLSALTRVQWWNLGPNFDLVSRDCIHFSGAIRSKEELQSNTRSQLHQQMYEIYHSSRILIPALEPLAFFAFTTIEDSSSGRKAWFPILLQLTHEWQLPREQTGYLLGLTESLLRCPVLYHC